jgi:hypothetical protein
MNPSDLERQVALGLAGLPAPHAPASLLPRVMAAVHAWAARPWYERAWFTWPIPLKVASCALVIALLTAGALGLPAAAGAVRGMAEPLATPLMNAVGEITGRAAAGFSAVRVLWSALIQPILFAAAPLVALMGVACATLGLAFSRFVSGRAFQP